MKHIITVRKDPSGKITLNGFVYQHDHGHIIRLEGFNLPAAWDMDFANSLTGECMTKHGSGNQVDLPEELLTSGNNVHCWIVTRTEREQLTKWYFSLPVIRRAQLPE